MINAVGLIVILVCVFGSFILSGGKVGIILEALPHELMAILGASIGAFLLGNSLRTVKLAGSGLKRAFKGPRWTAELYRDLLTLLFGLFTTFKKQGPMGIEPHLDKQAGFLVDEVADIVAINEAQIQPAPDVDISESGVIAGLVQVATRAADGNSAGEGGAMVCLLDLDQLDVVRQLDLAA